MPFQMAMDEVLFREKIENVGAGAPARPGDQTQGDHGGSPLLRFYFSSEPWITVGYSHGDITASPIPVCKRITGGGKVWHGDDLLFSIVGTKEDDESFKSVRISYWKIHEAVKAAYEEVGQKPRFYRCEEKLPRGGDCFTYPIATDLGVGNEKIAGGAQKRSSGVFLHQESLKVPAGVEAETLVQALRCAFERVFEIRLQNINCELEHLERAKKWAREKYYPQDSLVMV